MKSLNLKPTKKMIDSMSVWLNFMLQIVSQFKYGTNQFSECVGLQHIGFIVFASINQTFIINFIFQSSHDAKQNGLRKTKHRNITIHVTMTESERNMKFNHFCIESIIFLMVSNLNNLQDFSMVVFNLSFIFLYFILFR